jgi:DNA invertase Pin-like site-specific DNA recombinase
MEQKIIYLRVSKQDLDSGKTEQQVLEDQLPPILKKFNLIESECLILREKGSAYDIDKIKSRVEFLKMWNMCFNSKTTTLDDVLLGNYVKDSNLCIYVFDTNRLMRNTELGELFEILRYLYGIKLYSVAQEDLNCTRNDLIGTKLGKRLMGLINSNLNESYSNSISLHTKKAFHKVNGRNVSRDGKLSGRKLHNVNGEIVILTTVEQFNLDNRILHLTKGYSYRDIIFKIQKEYNGLYISTKYIRGVIQRDKIKDGN